ncbi:GFA family protein [Mesorhizobium sp. 43Arga]
MDDPRNVGQTSSPATRSLGNQFPRRAFRLDGYSTEFRPCLAVERTGGCLSGKIGSWATGDPRVHSCHCDMCRRATASTFAVLAWPPSAEVSWQSEELPTAGHHAATLPPRFHRLRVQGHGKLDVTPRPTRFCQACGRGIL